jgi:two-component system, LytTR family, response regulator
MKPAKTYKTNIISPTALWLPFQSGRRWVNLHQIVRLEGVGNYTTCIFADGTELLVALTLRCLQDRIPPGAFVRPHKKHLLNRTYVTSVHPAQFAVCLSNGDSVEIARRRVGSFRREMRLGPGCLFGKGFVNL